MNIMTDEEIRAAIAELTNMPVEFASVIRKFWRLMDVKCPSGCGLKEGENCNDDCDCTKCWLEALRHE